MEYKRWKLMFRKTLIASVLCLNTISSAEDFQRFVNKFFSDSSFQVDRVLFPFHEKISSLDSKTNGLIVTDTIAIETKENWVYIPVDSHENGSKYKVFSDTTKKNPTNLRSKYRKVEFSKKDTDFNMSLIFESKNEK